MFTISDINFQRQRFEKVCSYYGKKGIAPQLSLLRIEENLQNGKGEYIFDLKKENISAVERNLKRNDLFVTLAIGVALRIENSERPFVNTPMFDAVVSSYVTGTDTREPIVEGFKTSDINALYNGSLYISTGTTVNFQDMPLALFKRSQGTNVTNNQENEFSAIQAKSGKFNFENDLKAMAEEIIFSGTQDHTIKINFPTFPTSDYQALQTGDRIADESDFTDRDNRQSKVVFMALGYRVIGGTLPSYREDANPYKDCI